MDDDQKRFLEALLDSAPEELTKSTSSACSEAPLSCKELASVLTLKRKQSSHASIDISQASIEKMFSTKRTSRSGTMALNVGCPWSVMQALGWEVRSDKRLKFLIPNSLKRGPAFVPTPNFCITGVQKNSLIKALFEESEEIQSEIDRLVVQRPRAGSHDSYDSCSDGAMDSDVRQWRSASAKSYCRNEHSSIYIFAITLS
jgi:hypothetical protein